jgi:hypothetical protein
MTNRRLYIPLATGAAAAIGIALAVGTGFGQIGEKIGDNAARIKDNAARIERVELRTLKELTAINRKLDMLFSPRQ